MKLLLPILIFPLVAALVLVDFGCCEYYHKRNEDDSSNPYCMYVRMGYSAAFENFVDVENSEHRQLVQ